MIPDVNANEILLSLDEISFTNILLIVVSAWLLIAAHSTCHSLACRAIARPHASLSIAGGAGPAHSDHHRCHHSGSFPR